MFPCASELSNGTDPAQQETDKVQGPSGGLEELGLWVRKSPRRDNLP